MISASSTSLTTISCESTAETGWTEAPINATEQKIESFSSLSNGWHYGEGGAVDQTVIDAAKVVLQFLLQLGLTTTECFPGVDGEIMVTAYHQDNYIEIIVENDCSISVIYEKNKIECERYEHKNQQTILPALSKISEAIWGMSGGSTQYTTTKSGETLKVLHFESRLMEVHP